MKYKIAITDNDVVKPLYKEIDSFLENGTIDCLFTNETEAAELLRLGKVDIALLTPTSFADICKKIDLRVIPASALAANGYSELLNVSFKQNLKSIDKLLVPENNPYFEKVCSLILAERYDMEPELVHSYKGSDESSIDAYLSLYGQEKGDFSIDLTEDWLDSFDFCLPIAIWVCKAEIEDLGLIEMIKSFIDKETNPIESIVELSDNSAYDPRSGELHWHWNVEIEKALDETLDMLFYRGDVQDIVDVKIFGRNYESEVENEL